MGYIIPSSNAYNASVVVKLQRRMNSGWETVASWSAFAFGGERAQAAGSAQATAGYEYRVLTDGKIYAQNGTVLEELTQISATQYL